MNYQDWLVFKRYDNAVITMKSVTTISKVYGSNLWLRKVRDGSIVLSCEDYFIIYI